MSNNFDKHDILKDVNTGDVISIDGFEREKFKIGKIIEGGMGFVFELIPERAHTHNLALKTYKKISDRKSFASEAYNWISLGNHPNIARAVWFGTWLGRYSIVMDWYDLSLGGIDSNPLSAMEIQFMIREIIEGLKFAYENKHLIHQDIKPANIMIDSNGSPRVSDFGLSIFAAEKNEIPKDLFGLTKSKKKIVSYGKIGGTPFYMAPELFSGEYPSVKTDIYSLGVTLYEWLTKEHPYIGYETKSKFTNKLRIGPLQKVVDTRGQSFIPITKMIIGCIDLNVRERANSYQELLNRVEVRDKYRLKHTDKGVEDIVNEAMMLRKQGKINEAEHVLRISLKRYNNNPVILNAVGQLLLHKDNIDEALEYFQYALDILMQTDGLYNDKLYLDPAMNLAKYLIISKEFEGAENVLSLSWKWTGNGKNSLLSFYEEFGWYFLYDGNLDEACNFLLEMSEYRSLDQWSLQWLTLGLFFTDNLRYFCKKLAVQWVSFNGLTFVQALCACLVADETSDELSREIYSLIENAFFDDCLKVGEKFSLNEDWYKKPLDCDIAKLMACLIDIETTGGKYYKRHYDTISKKIINPENTIENCPH